jgi:hypothetical protein
MGYKGLMLNIASWYTFLMLPMLIFLQEYFK